jgi:cyclopropane fatty-acyl-phospholipid synthase-like methyltransferase
VGYDHVTPHCSVCLSPDVVKDPFYYVWNGRTWWILRCENCSHQFVYPFLTEQEKEEIYDDHYFSQNGDWVCGVWKSSYLEAETQLRKEAREVLDMLPIRSGKLLEIGCAGGFFLDEARKEGFLVTGIELNNSMAKHAREELGLSVVHGRIEDIPLKGFSEEFTAIVLMDVLEHIPKPRDAMERIKAWLIPGGYLLVRGLLANDPIAKLKEVVRRILKKNKRLDGYPLDVNSFTKRSLGCLFEENQLELTSWINDGPDFANLLARKH